MWLGCCWLSGDCCLLLVGCGSLFAVCCLLLAVCSCLLSARRHVSSVVCRLSSGMYYVLFVDWCLLRVACWLFVVLFGGVCLLFVVFSCWLAVCNVLLAVRCLVLLS